MMQDDVEALECRLVLEAIHARYGYDFRGYAEPTMRRRLVQALGKSGLESFGELQHRLLVDASFFRWLLDGLTVQVSDIFRDPGFYSAFRERVVPLLKTYPELKIWHAGCASGEEVYTTAILLTEAGLYDRAQLYATDISPSAIERAREGSYSDALVETFEQNYAAAGGTESFRDYYGSTCGRIVLRDSLRKNIVFFEHDLASDHALGEMHVVFCRNVLLYFGATLRARVVHMFENALVHGGFLCLGTSETLLQSSVGFAEFSREERIYRRRGAA